MPRSPLERILLLAALLLPAVLIANAVVSLADVRGLIRYEEDVRTSYRALTSIQDVVGVVTEAESGHRGFIITGQEGYLLPFWDAPSRLDDAVRRLDSLVAGEERQVARLRALESQALRRLELLSETMQLRATEGVESAQAAVAQGRGSRTMTMLRATAREMRETELALLEQRLEASSAAARRTFLTQVLATVIALGLLVWLFALSRRLFAARAELAASLQARHDELETQVRQRTLALSETNEHLRAEVAERRRVESSLRRFTLELERSNRELEDFAFIASHDLQEPLRKIQLFSDRLARRQADGLAEAARDDLDRIGSAATRMRALVDDLLAYARIGRVATRREPVPLDEVLGEVLETLEARIEETGARVEAGPLPVVHGDRGQLGQLLLNLLGNAIKFRREDEPPYIRLVATTEGDQLLLRVSDNGIGFDAQHADRIFSPFERLHGSEQYPGTGIGLAVCRRIAEHHGGTITAQSESAAGATFLVTLPLSDHALSAASLHDDPDGG